MYKKQTIILFILILIFGCGRTVDEKAEVKEVAPVIDAEKIQEGVYLCQKCGSALFRSKVNKVAQDGILPFDNYISDRVEKSSGKEGWEVSCKKCGEKLGKYAVDEMFLINEKQIRLFAGENFGRAIFASGCFWGTEYFLQKAKGVVSTSCGYTGGTVKFPTYWQVSSGNSGHAEAVEVIYDKSLTDFETLCKLFFETHNPTQLNRQGPDIGTQYRSEIFYLDDSQKAISEKLIEELNKSGLKVVTRLSPATDFYDAEEYHQDYYTKKKSLPYCHKFEKKFSK